MANSNVLWTIGLATLLACGELPSSTTLVRESPILLGESYVVIYEGPALPGGHGSDEVHLQLTEIEAEQWLDTFEFGEKPLTARITTKNGTSYVWSSYGSRGRKDIFIDDSTSLDALVTKIELSASPPLRVQYIQWISHSGP